MFASIDTKNFEVPCSVLKWINFMMYAYRIPNNTYYIIVHHPPWSQKIIATVEVVHFQRSSTKENGCFLVSSHEWCLMEISCIYFLSVKCYVYVSLLSLLFHLIGKINKNLWSLVDGVLCSAPTFELNYPVRCFFCWICSWTIFFCINCS